MLAPYVARPLTMRQPAGGPYTVSSERVVRWTDARWQTVGWSIASVQSYCIISGPDQATLTT